MQESIKIPSISLGSLAARATNAESRTETAQSAQSLKIDVQGLSVYYGTFNAIKNISVPIYQHRITAIIGPSGSGKSTFLRTLNRMHELVPNVRIEGQAVLDNKDIFTAYDVVELRKRVGMVFQRPNPFPKSIYDNVAYGPRMHGTRDKHKLDEIVERSLRSAALWDEVKDKMKTSGAALSGGQQQRLCIARTIAVEPDVILMDEPASALDPISTVKVEELMLQLRQRYTIVIVTHNMQQAARASDYTAVFVMSKTRAGELIEVGPTNEIFTSPKDKRTEDYISGRFG